MVNQNKLWFKLKESIEKEDYDLINNLQEICLKTDNISLKLELDYKLNSSVMDNHVVKNLNEMMCFNNQELIGYIGISHFGEITNPIEVSGMVHPAYRQQGVFKKLFDLVLCEIKKRKLKTILLLCDKNSISGHLFLNSIGAEHRHTEYEMYLKKENFVTFKEYESDLTFRKATNKDADEIMRQNTIYFKKDTESVEVEQPSHQLSPEEEEKNGMIMYLIEINQKVIGKVNLQVISNVGGIYGLGVLPEYRGYGYGRKILMESIKKLINMKAEEIILQVDSENDIAYNLYKSSGFLESSAMDYYEYNVNN